MESRQHSQHFLVKGSLKLLIFQAPSSKCCDQVYAAMLGSFVVLRLSQLYLVIAKF